MSQPASRASTPTAQPAPTAQRPQDATKFSRANVDFLTAMLDQLQPDTDDPEPLVDAMRELVEVVVWGDRYDEAIMDLFMERNTIAFFADAVDHPRANVRVKTQCFQCFTILLGNLSRPPSVYYVMSNNYINRVMASEGLDFENDEVVSNYISFVKALSLKLDSELVHFFFDHQRNRFPLYEHSVRLLDHSDRLVRTSVRQVVANVLAIEEPAVRTYMREQLPMFVTATCQHIIHTVSTLVRDMDAAAAGKRAALGVALVDGVIEDAGDDLYFFCDLHGACPDAALADSISEALVVSLANPLCHAAREEAHPAWMLLLANWVRINTLRDLQVRALLLEPVSVASSVLAKPGKVAVHPFAIAVLANVAMQWDKLDHAGRIALKALATVDGDGAHSAFVSASTVDALLLGLRSVLWRPRERGPLLCALALDTAVRLSRIPRVEDYPEDDAAAAAAAESAKAQAIAEGEPQLRRSIAATLWWYQQHVLSELATPVASASPQRNVTKRGSDSEEEAPATPKHARPTEASDNALKTPDTRQPKPTAKADVSSDEDENAADVHMRSPRRHRSNTEFHPRGAEEEVASAESGFASSPSSPHGDQGARGCISFVQISEIEDHVARHAAEANADTLYALLSVVAKQAPASWLSPLKQSMSRAGRDVTYLTWSQLAGLAGPERHRHDVLCLALLRSTIDVSAAGGTFRKNAGAAWGLDAGLKQVADASAIGADAVPLLRPADCVPTQVCAVDDVDASHGPVLAKDATLRGVPLGDVLFLSLVGGQLVLIDFSLVQPREATGSSSAPSSKANFVQAGKAVLVLPLAWCCAIVESQRPFRLRVSAETDADATAQLVPLRELGLVLRDRGLCRAVASRLNEAALAARDVCRNALTQFLNTPLEP